MLRKISVSVLALAFAGFASSAMAACVVGPWGGPPPVMNQQIDAQNYCVDVNIQVEEEVSMWANNDDISLVMSGADGANSATAASSLTVINNVDAKIDALVDGTLPAPIVPGGGINFFIFNGGTPASAVAAIGLNAYTPAGAAVWDYGTLGNSQTIIANTGVHTSMYNFPIVYASDAPGEIPLPNSYNLTVVYTISPA